MIAPDAQNLRTANSATARSTMMTTARAPSEFPGSEVNHLAPAAKGGRPAWLQFVCERMALSGGQGCQFFLQFGKQPHFFRCDLAVCRNKGLRRLEQTFDLCMRAACEPMESRLELHESRMKIIHVAVELVYLRLVERQPAVARHGNTVADDHIAFAAQELAVR